MTFRTIIKDQIKGNLPFYKAYFLATFFSVTVIFMSLMITEHPDLQFSSLSKSFINAGKAVTCIIAVFLFMFIYYSEYTFIKHRSRDYALFTIVGMKHRQLALLNGCESFVVFLSAFVLGIALSLLLSRFIFLGFTKFFGIEALSFYFPVKALSVTAMVFALLFLVIETATIILLKKTQIKDFLQFGKKAQKLKKANVPLAIAGSLLIVLGFYLAATATDQNLLHRIIPVTLMEIVGMYCFYREICPWLLQVLSSKKRFYYKGVHMLWVSDLKYRIKDFSVILFLITLTMTVGLTGFSAAFNVASVELGSNPMAETRYPIAILAQDPASPVLVGTKQLLDSLQVEYAQTNLSLFSNNQQDQILIRQSDLPFLMDRGLISQMDFSQSDTLALPIESKSLYVPLPYKNILAVADSKIDNNGLLDKANRMQLALFSYSDKINIGRDLMRIQDNGLNQTHSFSYVYSSQLFKYFYFMARRSYLLISFYFVIIFYICAACMLYFKFFNNAVEEGAKYANYTKVGLSVREIRRSTTIQMASLFFLPLVLTILNTAFAMKAIINTDAPETFISNTLIIVVFTVLIQFLYFLFIRHRYLKRITVSPCSTL